MQWDETRHITKVQYYVKNINTSDMFDEKEMNAWENRTTGNKNWTDAKAYFEDLYQSKQRGAQGLHQRI